VAWRKGVLDGDPAHQDARHVAIGYPDGRGWRAGLRHAAFQVRPWPSA
jgi:hypothetical protein